MAYMVIAFAILSIVTSVLVIAACAMSSRISEEEARECEE